MKTDVKHATATQSSFITKLFFCSQKKKAIAKQKMMAKKNQENSESFPDTKEKK